MERSCIFCTAEATHTLYPNQATGHWEARVADFSKARQQYCTRCAVALAAGESGEQLSRRLNEEYKALCDERERESANAVINRPLEAWYLSAE